MASYRHGYKSGIARETGLSVTTVRTYFVDQSIVSTQTKKLIEAVKDKYLTIGMEPNRRRDDILKQLRYGDQTDIANKCGCEARYVLNILQGNDNQQSELARKIIREGEKKAAINIWLGKYCKYPSML